MNDPLGDVDDGIELGFDRGSALAFWEVLLLFASYDNATRVKFRPDEGEHCLAIDAEGQEWEVVPPPPEFRDWLFDVGGEWIAGNGVIGRSRCWLANRRGQSLTGEVTVRSTFGWSQPWIGHWLPMMRRLEFIPAKRSSLTR